MSLTLTDSSNVAAAINVDSPLTAHCKARMDVLRFVAICSVIWGHCLLGLERRVFASYPDQLAQSALLQSGRVGTIIFFLISGYLICEKIPAFTVSGYLRYRFRSLIVPWLVFLIVLVILQLFDALSAQQLIHGKLSHTLSLAFSLFKGSIFHAAYWFVPVALISVLLLIVFKNLVTELWFGVILAGVTLFYSINLYHGWVSTNHTQAFLGYAFFVWLGAQIKIHQEWVKATLDKTTWMILLPMVFCLFVIACREGMKLRGSACIDPYASIRVSNAVLSVLLFFCFIKSSRLKWIGRLKPRQSTFGIYLVHLIIISELTPFVNRLISKYNLYYHLPGLVLLQLLFFTAVLLIAFVFVVVVRRSPLRFMLGAKG